jgi:hypothetical protein
VPDLHDMAGRIAAPLVLMAAGGGMWLLSRSQPAYLGEAIGPGFMARGLAIGVILLAVLWCAASFLRPVAGGVTADRGATLPPKRAIGGSAGFALLAGVLAFALSVPSLGLAAGAGLAAGLAAWATGERSPRTLAGTAALLAALTAVIGLVLLPPTAPLWPTL